jgi:formylglycine-generating enzyme required for sulfatase activity
LKSLHPVLFLVLAAAACSSAPSSGTPQPDPDVPDPGPTDPGPADPGPPDPGPDYTGCTAGCEGRVAIPGGEYRLGCADPPDPDCKDWEGKWTATLAPFEIDRYEVTVAAFSKCLDAGACTAPSLGDACNYWTPGAGTYPMNCVSWDQARAFCAWAGGRLCSEAEWEAAARGPDVRRFPWGDAPATCDRAVMWDGTWTGCSRKASWPVGSRPAGATPEGLLDMAGNAGEWVEDCWTEGGLADGKANPLCDQPGHVEKVVRGGDWSQDAQGLRGAARRKSTGDTREATTGLRCCRSGGAR